MICVRHSDGRMDWFDPLKINSMRLSQSRNYLDIMFDGKGSVEFVESDDLHLQELINAILNARYVATSRFVTYIGTPFDDVKTASNTLPDSRG